MKNRALMKLCSQNTDGKISLEEFKAGMLKTTSLEIPKEFFDERLAHIMKQIEHHEH